MVFGSGSAAQEVAPAVDVKTLHVKIGELTLENDILSGAPGRSGPAERKAMINREHGLPLRRQAAALQLSRSSLYDAPRPVASRAGGRSRGHAAD